MMDRYTLNISSDTNLGQAKIPNTSVLCIYRKITYSLYMVLLFCPNIVAVYEMAPFVIRKRKASP